MGARAAASALGAVSLLAAHVLAAPAAMAIAPPVIDPGALPAAQTPGPAEEMRQSEACITPVVIADPNVTQPAPGNAMLDLTQAWQYSTGAGCRWPSSIPASHPTRGSRRCSPAATMCRACPTAG
jgi:membrane-anchored mycosin MYCP